MSESIGPLFDGVPRTRLDIRAEWRRNSRAYRARHPERISRANAEWRERNRVYDRSRKSAWRKARPDLEEERRAKSPSQKRRRRWGLSRIAFDEMLAAQGGRCAICRTDDPLARSRWPAFLIDHDHVTGQIRGLLCNGCNGGIGFFLDDPALLMAAIAYLQRWGK